MHLLAARCRVPHALAMACWLFAQMSVLAADLEFAHGLYRDKRYELAAEEYRRYLQTAATGPSADEARFYLAESLVQLGKPDQAVVEYDRLIGERNPRRPNYRLALFRAGELRLLANQSSQATGLLEQFLSAFPNDELSVRAWLYLAEAHLENGQLDAAQSALVGAQKLLPAGELADRHRFLLARLATGRKDYDKAASLLAELKRQPGSPLGADATLALALLDIERGRFAQSLGLLDGFIKANPTSRHLPQALYYVGRAGLETKQPQIVQAAYDRLAREFAESVWRDRLAVTFAEAMLLPAADDASGAKRRQALGRLKNEVKASDARIRIAYLESLFLFDREAYSDSIRLLDALLSASGIDPRTASDAQYLRGVALAKMSRWQPAADALETFLAGRPDEALVRPAAQNWADAMVRLDNHAAFERGAGRIMSLLRKRDDGAELALLIADAHYRAKLFAQAGWAYEQSIGLSGTSEHHARARIGAGWCLYETGRHEPARQHFVSASQTKGLDRGSAAESHYMAGVCAQQLSRPIEAIASLLRVVTDYGDSEYFVDAGRRAASLLVQADRGKEADAVYEMLMQHASGKGTVAANGDPPDRPVLLFERARLAANNSQRELAARLYAELADKHPASELAADALARLGEIEFEAGRLDEAIRRFTAVAARPQAAKLHDLARLRIAQSHLLAKRWQAAFDSAERAGAATQDRTIKSEALYVQGRALQQQARFDEAREKFTHVIGAEKTELAAKAQFMIGQTYFHQKKHDDAIKAFLKVVLLYAIPDWQAAALLEVGKCHEQKRDTAAARREYESLVERFPDTPSAKDARERLGSLKRL